MISQLVNKRINRFLAYTNVMYRCEQWKSY
jgi:hypothetical protein